jgi:hypothetical protein
MGLGGSHRQTYWGYLNLLLCQDYKIYIDTKYIVALVRLILSTSYFSMSKCRYQSLFEYAQFQEKNRSINWTQTFVLLKKNIVKL